MTVSKEAKTAADEAKKSGFKPMYVVVAGAEYVYRGVTRKEWRLHLEERNSLLKEAEQDEVRQAEIQEEAMESIVGIALIFPEFNKDTFPAGAIQTLSDNILLASGFGGPDIDPVEL